MGNEVQAVNIISGEKCMLLIDSRLINEQDIAGLELLL